MPHHLKANKFKGMFGWMILGRINKIKLGGKEIP